MKLRRLTLVEFTRALCVVTAALSIVVARLIYDARTIRQVEMKLQRNYQSVREFLLTDKIRDLKFDTISYKLIWSRSVDAPNGVYMFISYHKPFTPRESQNVTHSEDDIRSKAFVVFWVDGKGIIRRIDLGVRDVGHGIIPNVKAEKEAMDAALGTRTVPVDALEKRGWSTSGSDRIYDCDEFLTRKVITEPVVLSDLSKATFIHRAIPDGRMKQFTGSWFLLFSDADGNILERVPYNS